MGKEQKIIKKVVIITILALAIVFCAGVSLYITYLYNNPDKLKTKVEDHLAVKSGGEVRIEKAELRFQKGIVLLIDNLDINVKGQARLTSNRVIGYIRPWLFIFKGIGSIRLKAERPELFLKTGAGLVPNSRGNLWLPNIELVQGRVEIEQETGRMVFNNINARTGENSLFVEGDFPGGYACIDIKKKLGSKYSIQKFVIKVPGCNLSGKGVITDLKPGQMDKAVVELDMAAAKFAYKDVVNALPVSFFDDWLKNLLTEQIRGGMLHVQKLTYRGTLKNITSADTFFESLYIKARLSGLSFGSGFGPERVTNISGDVVFQDGSLLFTGLSGVSGGSKLKKVDLAFPGITKPGFRISVGIDLDMATADFVASWRAVMTEKYLHDLLKPVSNISSGRIIAKTQIVQEADDAPLQLFGSTQVDACTFQWEKSVLQALSGTAVVKGFNSPVEIELAGILNGRRVDKASIILTDPFGKQTYTFNVNAGGYAGQQKVFNLAKESDIEISGKGRGPSIEGDIDLLSPGFDLFGTPYRTRQGSITGKGKLSGLLWPEYHVDLKAVELDMCPGSLKAKYLRTNGTEKLDIKGDFDMENPEAAADGIDHPLKGSLDLHVVWEDGIPLSGKVECENISLYYLKNPMVFNGPLEFADGKLLAEEFMMENKEVKTVITGSLALDDPLYFKGSVSIDGFGTGGDTPIKTEVMRSFNADADLIITNFGVRGVKIGRLDAKAKLKDGSLKLNKVSVHGPAADVDGAAAINRAGMISFDMDVSLRNAGVGKLFHIFSDEEPWIEGGLNAEGRLWGSTGAINGELKLTSENGHIKQYSLLSKIFAALNVYKMVETKGDDFKKEGFTYNQISTTLKFNNGLVKFDDFSLESNSLQMSSVGEYFMPTKEIDAMIGVQLFETLDKTISYVPLLGWLLTGDDCKLFVVSFVVSGNIDDPAVKPAPLDTVTRPVAETLVRILKLPYKIVTSPKDLMPGMNGKKHVVIEEDGDNEKLDP